MASLRENGRSQYQNFYLPLQRNHWLYIEKELNQVFVSMAWRNVEEILRFSWSDWSLSLSFQLKEFVWHPANGVFMRKWLVTVSKFLFALVKKSLTIHWKRVKTSICFIGFKKFWRNIEVLLQFLVTIIEFSIKRICMTPGKWRFYQKMVGSSIKIFTCNCKEITDYTLKKS